MPWKERLMRIIAPVFDKSVYFLVKKQSET